MCFYPCFYAMTAPISLSNVFLQRFFLFSHQPSFCYTQHSRARAHHFPTPHSFIIPCSHSHVPVPPSPLTFTSLTPARPLIPHHLLIPFRSHLAVVSPPSFHALVKVTGEEHVPTSREKTKLAMFKSSPCLVRVLFVSFHPFGVLVRVS